MDLRAILDRLDFERREVAWDGEASEVTPLVTRRAAANGSWHSVSYSCLTSENADLAISEQIEHYRRMGSEFEWKYFTHDRPDDLASRLAKQGLIPNPEEMVLIHETASAPSSDVKVVRVDTPELLETYRKISEEAFGRDQASATQELRESLESGSNQLQGFIAFVGEVATCAGRLYISPKSWFAGLYGGGTPAEFRGRGYYRALVAARMTVAKELGVRYALVDSLPTSQPILKSLGFVRLTDTIPFDWKPENANPV